MKKRVFWALIVLAFVVAVTASAAISAAVAKRAQAKQSGSEDDTQIGTLDGSEHLSPSETSEQTTEESFEQTTAIENTSEITTIEETTVMEETGEPMPSLEYESFGNGTCAVVGIGSYTDSYLTIPEKSPEGYIVIAISEKAFYGNSFIRAIEIPSTISSIGELAFANCSQLVYLAVDDSNQAFMDIGGVLFTYDGSMLICYPPASSSASLEIPTTVNTICDMAFYGCENLKQINYSGSLEDWAKIDIGEKNYGLYTAAIAFGK